jgi:hypothetical protein
MLEAFGHAGELLLTLPLLGVSQGKVVPLRRASGGGLRPGHYLVSGWKPGDAGVRAYLELADVDLSTEARLIDAGSAQRAEVSRMLSVRGIAAPVGGLDGRRGVIHAASVDAAPVGRGLWLTPVDILRLIALLDADRAGGTVVLTIAGQPHIVQ